jgi:hypothetical protein
MAKIGKSRSIFLEGEDRPARKADNLTVNCEQMV